MGASEPPIRQRAPQQQQALPPAQQQPPTQPLQQQQQQQPSGGGGGGGGANGGLGLRDMADELGRLEELLNEKNRATAELKATSVSVDEVRIMRLS